MIYKLRHIVYRIGIFIIPFLSIAQNDLASKEEIILEQQDINFQTFFFESLQQKAIGNYDKAIFALEACNNIDQGNVAVLFELSKNYSFSNKLKEAEYYILKGLEIESKNIYMLRFLKEIKLKQNDYAGAILIKKRIVIQKPEEESDLVILYIKSGDINSAIDLLNKLGNLDRLPPSLVILRESLTLDNHNNNEVSKSIEQPKSKLEGLKETYNVKGDFDSLKRLLEREFKTKRYLELFKDSEEALKIYPAQPYVYLMNARALNGLRKYDEAIEMLESGLEFLIDDINLEIAFMEQLSLSYKGLGQNKQASIYYKKFLDLQNK